MSFLEPTMSHPSTILDIGENWKLTTSDKALFLIQELLLSQPVKIPELQGKHIYFLLHKNCIFVHARPSSYNGRSVISNNQIASVCEEIVVLKEKSCLDFIINRNGVFRTQRSTK